ncbi:MAG TPA: hypothetical protein VFX52_05760 [Nocardioidaceae bacterium]|nr:hypothetical protein [Nocardioidaceae bacterium]
MPGPSSPGRGRPRRLALDAMRVGCFVVLLDVTVVNGEPASTRPSSATPTAALSRPATIGGPRARVGR